MAKKKARTALSPSRRAAGSLAALKGRFFLFAFFIMVVLADSAWSDASWENVTFSINDRDANLPYAVEYDEEPVCLDAVKNAEAIDWATKDCKKISASFYLDRVTDVGCSPAPASITAYSAVTEKSCKGVLRKTEMKDVVDCCGVFTGKFWLGAYEFDGNCFRAMVSDNVSNISVLLPAENYDNITYIKKSDFKKPSANALKTMIDSDNITQFHRRYKTDFFNTTEDNVFAWQKGKLMVYDPGMKATYGTEKMKIESSSCLMYEDASLSVLRCPETLPKNYPDITDLPREFVQYFKKDSKNDGKSPDFKNFYANLPYQERGEDDERTGLEHVILRYTTKNTNERYAEAYYVMANGNVFSEFSASLSANAAGRFAMERRSEALYRGECDCEPRTCTFK